MSILLRNCRFSKIGPLLPCPPSTPERARTGHADASNARNRQSGGRAPPVSNSSHRRRGHGTDLPAALRPPRRRQNGPKRAERATVLISCKYSLGSESVIYTNTGAPPGFFLPREAPPWPSCRRCWRPRGSCGGARWFHRWMRRSGSVGTRSDRKIGGERTLRLQVF